jgi:hypothetical protein
MSRLMGPSGEWSGRDQMPTTSPPSVGDGSTDRLDPKAEAAAVCGWAGSGRVLGFWLLGVEAGQEGVDAELELVVGGDPGQLGVWVPETRS